MDMLLLIIKIVRPLRPRASTELTMRTETTKDRAGQHKGRQRHMLCDGDGSGTSRSRGDCMATRPFSLQDLVRRPRHLRCNTISFSRCIEADERTLRPHPQCRYTPSHCEGKLGHEVNPPHSAAAPQRHRLRNEAAGPRVEDITKGVVEVLEASSQRAQGCFFPHATID
jgi:hypothetical protein